MKKVSSIVVVVSLLFAMVSIVSAESFLENEAGISASIQLSSANLSLAETAFKNIEKKTASYIVGSVAIAGYDERYDVHVYVDASGHMVAYYLKSEPASKIIDWINYAGGPMTLAGCKLEDALAKVCNAMFFSLPAVTYFDFRYPNAQIIKIVTDEELSNDSTETFNMMIPSGQVVYNVTWSHVIYDGGTLFDIDSYLALDGSNLHFYTVDLATGWHFWEGEIDQALLSVDTHHEFAIRNGSGWQSYAGIVIIYSETP